jgi:L-alanine-DL-glutamate epimerase-like enolase superfamily enzyme
MEIVRAEAFLCDVPAERPRVDAIQRVDKQETIFVDLETSDGVSGRGYGYTIGTGGRAVLALLRSDLLPRLVGRDGTRIDAVWQDLFSAVQFMTVGPVATTALAAVDIALWDIRCKAAGLPLWRLAGGAHDSVPVYDTDGGWLQLSADELVANGQQRLRDGWPAIKVKVGRPTAKEDYDRLAAVRGAIGPDMDLMVDANQCFTASEARRRAHMWEELDIAWFEEPLPADDVGGHALLAAGTEIPIAVGESLYSLRQFQDYLSRGAVGIVQADVVRVGGITPWLKTAHLAEAFNVPIAPHYLMELSVSVVAAVPNGRWVEHVPELRAITEGELAIRGGCVSPPDEPGVGIRWDVDAIDSFRAEE